MVVTVEEKWDSRDQALGLDSQQSSGELLWIVTGTSDDQVAVSETLLATPTTFAGLPLLNVSVDRIAEEVWGTTANYGDKNFGTTPEPAVPIFSFDTTGGSSHISQSLATNAFSGATPAPDSKGAIGDNGDTVEGVDIPTPVYNFSETHLVPVANVTPAYKATLFALTGTINGGFFKGFSNGEVLYLGTVGSLRNANYWELSYSFAALPNITGVQIGDITGINKRGWDYLDIRREKDEDSGKIVNVPTAVYVHKVFEDGNFGFLGIGI